MPNQRSGLDSPLTRPSIDTELTTANFNGPCKYAAAPLRAAMFLEKVLSVNTTVAKTAYKPPPTPCPDPVALFPLKIQRVQNKLDVSPLTVKAPPWSVATFSVKLESVITAVLKLY